MRSIVASLGLRDNRVLGQAASACFDLLNIVTGACLAVVGGKGNYGL